eukprot:TRINITY_DN701_c0_g1_i7.p1 TRINITY_DN701_c0_g1~~TRINITY_DN701_c0_g1_i7.p1  ORF type:complete len:665 (-),score=237.21 TRINITY_DN701_c0_g1_i7:400-2154(-)
MVGATVFNSLELTSVALPEELLKEAFEERPKTKEELEEEARKKREKEEAAKREAAKARATKVSLLDPTTARNVGIVYKMFRMKPDAIAQAVLSMDASALSVDKLISLRSVAPTSEQLPQLTSYSGLMVDLDEVTAFMVTVARIPRYTARLECTLFIRAFAEDAAFLKGRVTMVRTAVTEVVDSEKLRKLLVMVMNMGNFLNEGTRQGNARGFKMASLLKLETVKTLDRTKTSLHVLAEWGKKSMPEVLKLEDDLQHCKEASSWSLTDLHSEIAAMRKGLTQVQAQLAASENQKDKPPQDRFAETAAAFLRTAVSRMHELEDLLQKTTAAYREAAQLFGEDPGTVPSGEFFALMTEFVTMLGRAVKENHQREVLEEKRRRSEEKAAKAAKLKQAKLEKQQREGTDKGIGAFQRMPSRAPSGRLMQARAKSGIIPMAADTSDHVPPTVLNDKFNRIKEERAIEGAILRPQLQAQLRSGRSMIVRERMPSRRATASTKFMDGGTSSTSLARFDSHANISSSSGARERMAAQRMRTQRLSHAAATQSGLRAPSHPSPFRPQAVRAGSTVPANMRSSFKRLRSTTFIGR